MHWLEILERLREEQSPKNKEATAVLQLPVPPKYFEYEQIPNLKEEISEQRGVVVLEIFENSWGNS